MQPLPHGYTHDTRTDGRIVVKRYQGPDADARRSAELLVLTKMPDAVPVPGLVAHPPGELWMQYVPGTHGQDLIEAGGAAEVLRSCGQTLRLIQSVPANVVFPSPAGVIVHGDYGPNNMLFDPDTCATAAVLDWEWAHTGDPVEDLAWCEWITRMHHPDAVGELDHLFKSYGRRPPWPSRQRAMLAKCRSMLHLFHPAGAAAPGARRWQQFIKITEAWTE